jgi:transcriptional antiterminator RfaH
MSEPLFPRYLFIRLDSVHDNWAPIRSTRGVNQIVRFNDRPVPVRDEVIESIRARLTEHLDDEPYLKPGQRVRITEGAFSQLEALILATDGAERVILLLNILQQDQQLVFPLHSIRRLA